MNGPGYRAVYHYLVVEKDIPRLDRHSAARIKSAIERKLLTRPEIYGTPLRGILRRFWKLRVGDWRIVYLVVGREVRVLAIAHRREVYELVRKRT